MTEDADLLRHYAEDRSEPALTELVNRHIGAVHATALRRLGGDTHHAADVVQMVFSTMAQRAGSLSRHPSLAGWLHLASKHAAIDLVKAEQRRRLRESEAMDLQELQSPTPSEAETALLKERIDEVLDSLNSREREAVLLRHYKDLSYAEIGEQLKLSEDAARMCVTRALNRMKEALSRRGIKSSAGAITALLCSEAAASAPAGLAAATIQGVLAGKAGLSGLSVLSLGLFMNAGKIALGTAALVTLATGGWLLSQQQDLKRLQSELALEQGRSRERAAQLTSLGKETAALSGKLAESKADRTALQQRIDSIPAAKEVATEEQVKVRLEKARLLAKQGLYAESVKEYIWLIKVGMKGLSGYEGGVRQVMPMELMEMAVQYPAARQALSDLRDEVEQAFLSKADSEIQLLITLNTALNTPERSLAAFDKLEEGDSRRRTFQLFNFAGFVKAGRYADAAKGNSMASLVFHMESTLEHMKSRATDEASKRSWSKSIIERSALGIEMLAGSGDLENARVLTQKLLQSIDTPEARESVKAAFTRAGHPEMANEAPTP